jgi:hypothetical protein
MEIVRRVYFYVVAAASLGMLVAGIANLGAALIDIAFGAAIERTARESLAISGALILVGLPIWALHWGLANRAARANTADRASALRRLYAYGTAGALLLGVALLGTEVVQGLLHVLARSSKAVDGTEILRHAWQALLAGVFWWYQLRAAAADRAAVGEEGASATLRRWYAYTVQVITLFTILFVARDLLRSMALSVLQPAHIVRDQATIENVGTMLVALALWAFHAWRSSVGSIADEDRPATLRAVHGFLVLAVSVALTLYDASQMLYYALARALGVPRPGGIEADLAAALVNPVTTIVVFGLAWILMRARLREDARASNALPAERLDPRRDGIRRLYAHLVALLALMALASGLTGILWTLSDLIFDMRPATANMWRDQISLALTLLIVGLLTWLGHWRPAPALTERVSLSRRLYLFAALLFSVLALLGAGAALVHTLLGMVMAVPNTTISTIGHALSASLVAGGIAFYHWRVLQADLAARRADAALEGAEPAPPVMLSAEPTVVEITGADLEEIRRALAALPARASYSFRGSERPIAHPVPAD